MEKRAIQKTGGSSFIVTLPKAWITKQALDQKGSVNMYIHPGGQLIIQSEHRSDLSEGSLSIDYLSDTHISRELIGLYLSGIERINVSARTITYEQRALIRSVSYKLIGFEMFEETAGRIVLKNVARPNILSPDYVRNLVDIIEAMFSDMEKTIVTNNKNLARDIVERDVEVDRIHLAILRQYNKVLHSLVPEKTGGLELFDLHYFEVVSLRLERIADHIVQIARTISLTNGNRAVKLNKFELANVAYLHEYFKLLRTILTGYNMRDAHKLMDLFETRRKNAYLNKTIINKPGVNLIIEGSIERMRSYMANIAEETINYASIKSVLPERG